jgi:hypothetical protein
MSPYRQCSSVECRASHRKRSTPVREKLAAILLTLIAADLAAFIWRGSTWILVVGGTAIIVFIAILLSARSRTPFTRLCALQWNRGDRLGATLLFFNVIEPRYSPKRIARNKAALEAAQVGMPKYRSFSTLMRRDE